MSEYTPSDQEFRDWVVRIDAIAFHRGVSVGRFDRWLAAHDERVRTREQERCAQIAEDAYFGGGAAGSTHRWAAKQVAAAIRAVSAETEEVVHDRDRLGICRKCGDGLSAAEILDGETRCSGASRAVSAEQEDH